MYEFGKIYHRLQLVSMSEQPAIACNFSKFGACSMYKEFLVKKCQKVQIFPESTCQTLKFRTLSCSSRQKTISEFKHLKVTPPEMNPRSEREETETIF